MRLYIEMKTCVGEVGYFRVFLHNVRKHCMDFADNQNYLVRYSVTYTIDSVKSSKGPLTL